MGSVDQVPIDILRQQRCRQRSVDLFLDTGIETGRQQHCAAQSGHHGYGVSTPDVAGTYVVQLVVNDGTVDSTPDAVTITATAAGPDGAGLFSSYCAGCHGADGTQLVNVRGVSATTIQSRMPHKGITIDDIGGTAGAQAIADFLSQ